MSPETTRSICLMYKKGHNITWDRLDGQDGYDTTQISKDGYWIDGVFTAVKDSPNENV